MSSNKITLAIFDFDGTLTTGHLWVGIAKHHKAHKVKRIALYTYLFSHMPFWLAAKMKLYSEEKNRARWGEDIAGLFKGFSTSEARQAFEWVMDNYFSGLMRQDIIKLLNEHKKQGHKIVLLSGMLSDFLEVVGNKLGADFTIGTKMEAKNNKYTGRIIKPLCFGQNKADLLLAYFAKNGIQVDLKNSYAYADSIFDLPVFEMVGNPVACYPDEKLAQLAADKKWRIIGNLPAKHS